MQQYGLSKLDIKRQNRTQILKILKQQGPTSRIDIANMLELTRAAVTIITNEMIAQGIIHEVGEYQSINKKAPRGRKKILIDINQNYKFVLGVLIDNNTISVGISTLSGAVLDKRNLDINKDIVYQEIVDFIIESINSILLDNCLQLDEILGIGFGICPEMYKNTAVQITDGEPDYTMLAADIYERFKTPMIFDNSIKGMAMANIDFYPEKDQNRNYISFLRYGESIHFAVSDLNCSVDPYDSRTDFVDNIIIDPAVANNDRPFKGSVKAELSRTGIMKKIVEAYSEENTPVLFEITDGNIDKVTYETIKSAVLDKDETVRGIIDKAIKLGAVLINNLYYLTASQRIVLHNLRITDEEFEQLRKKIANIVGKEVASKLDLSIIDKKHGFLSGCAIAIRELFFVRGGYDTSENIE